MPAVILILIAFLFLPTGAFCGEEAGSKKPEPLFPAETSKSLMDDRFVVETSDDDASDSLNRISGDYDLGFASEESTYHSVHHGRSTSVQTHEDAYDVTSH